MKRKTAYKIAITAINKQMRPLLFDANSGQATPEALRNDRQRSAIKKVEEYTKAINILDAEMEGEQLSLFEGLAT